MGAGVNRFALPTHGLDNGPFRAERPELIVEPEPEAPAEPEPESTEPLAEELPE
jgi:hypothetical protein